jgi:hypothetical protein
MGDEQAWGISIRLLNGFVLRAVAALRDIFFGLTPASLKLR